MANSTCSDTCSTGNATDVNNTSVSEETLDHLAGVCRIVFCQGSTQDLVSVCKHYYPDIYKEIQHEETLLQNVSKTSQIVLTVLISVIMFIALVGNTLVILTFIVNRHMRSVTNVFILSLAVSDLMVTLTCFPMNMGAILTKDWVFGSFGCKLLPCITSFLVACSSLTLCCIAFDRYYAIVHPLKLKLLQTPERATILLVIVWAVSLATSIPYVFFYDTIELDACVGYEDSRESMFICYTPNLRGVKKVFYDWVSILVLFFIPFFFMTCMYAAICYKLWIQRPVGNGTQSHHDFRIRLKKRVVKMLIVVVLLFVVCWSPILFFNAIAESIVVPLTESNIDWQAYLQCLSISSCCWNPLVYAFMNEKFRKAFKTLLTCHKGRVHPIAKRNPALRMSTESRRTTTQLEVPVASGSAQTEETKI